MAHLYRNYEAQKVAWNTIVQETFHEALLVEVNRMHKMETGWYIGFAGFGCDDMFVLLDNEMKIKNSFGESPIELMPSQNYLSLYGWFTSYSSKLFFAAQPTGYLCCYNVDKEGKVNKEWEKFLTQPEYDASSNKWKKENKRGTYGCVI